MADPSMLAGKTALVTGAGRGIGRAIAIGLCEAGCRLVLVARSADQLGEVEARVKDLGGEAHVLQADLAQLDAAVDLPKRIEALGASIDLLINNAATIAPVGPSVAIDPFEWQRAMTLNVTSVAALSFALAAPMLERGWGRIVNVSSGLVERPTGMNLGNAYSTTKAALERHTFNFANELAGTGVTVNVYRPGGVDTAMQAYVRSQPPEMVGERLHARFVQLHEEGGLITPETSAAALVRRLGSETTGQNWDVDDPVEG